MSKHRRNYREHFLRTAPVGNRDSLVLGAMGLAGETGEVVDLLKKHLFHSKELDRDKLILELGDVRWYMECIITSIKSSMEEVEDRNVEKLLRRFPKGFNPEDAEAKKDVTP